MDLISCNFFARTALMPPHCIQDYHSRPTTRSIFSPERLLTPPPSTLRSAFTFIDHYDVTDPDEPETAESSSSKSYRPILMLKPRGEVSRAYNLQVEMKVDDKQFTDVQGLISRLVPDHLETSLSFRQQSSADLDTIYEKVI
ncbi:uncharacterized protein LACBIDRAFT_316680 [Laccaria bicolor S238N-H82]|uniref:Predicted protein n=1 Tax=Laccaria bicolor (strain S238N-H82 / ATCC MYA-4686) TaxID=486041 RepID=B0E1E5_LACBS|nr:uncharacterized protein LACBIDRAFT_316680 [Laccaria bicolor S238N-H82]EDQ99316.1 predicted protein [Laccaria bicolor S238N-H82]|eukprot:XP_001890036.1 predicted protein [Laccaria bicolor S238N-H82]